MRFLVVLLLAVAAGSVAPGAVCAQDPGAPAYRSPQKAVVLSLLVPGLGHRYVQHGDWDGAATFYALADASLWLGLFGTEASRARLVSDYQTFAASYAGADVAGKDRQFFLNLATYRSSDEYLEYQLRQRAWNQIDYVAERTNQWQWQTEADFVEFRELREDAESLRRRRTFLVGLLVANRLVSGFTALRAAGRANDGPDLTLSFAPPPPDGRAPVLNLHLRF